jgi:hypothetical protein
MRLSTWWSVMVKRGTVGPLQAILAVLLVATACDEDNPFRSVVPVVNEGDSEVWELALPEFPSGWDFAVGERFFIGTTEIGSTFGTWVLDSRTDGTLILRPFSTLAPGLSLIRTGIIDLGAVPFDTVEIAPAGGYSSVSDPAGVPVIEGHTYAFRISFITGGVVPINYAKLSVIDLGQEFAGNPSSRFIRFEWAYQVQPLNRRLVADL